MITVERIRIQKLNGEQVTDRDRAIEHAIVFETREQLEKFRKTREKELQAEYNAMHPENAKMDKEHRTKISVLFDLKEDKV